MTTKQLSEQIRSKQLKKTKSRISSDIFHKKMSNQIFLVSPNNFDHLKEDIVIQSQCQLCYMQSRLMSMFRCSHQYCTECLNKNYKERLACFQLIRCPNCLNLMVENNSIFENATQQEKQKYKRIKLRKQVEMDKLLRLCPDENCPYGVIKLEKQDQIEGKCSDCKSVYCLKCLNRSHEGKKCKQNQPKKIIKAYNYRQCPNCKRIVERIQGCNHMTCKCSNSFCYQCGNEWSGNHKCSISSEEQLITNKIRSFLQIDEQQKCYKKIAFFLIMFGWILTCLIMGVLLLPFLIIGYMIRGNYILLKEGCHNSKWCHLFVWLLLLPLGIVFITVLIIIIDTKRRSNRWIFRLFLTAELSY